MTVPSSLSVLPSRSTVFGVLGDHLAGGLADDLQDAAVVVHGVGGVARRIAGSVVGRMDETVLLNPGQFGQIDVVEEELDVIVIEKEIRHGATPGDSHSAGLLPGLTSAAGGTPAITLIVRSLISIPSLSLSRITYCRSP